MNGLLLLGVTDAGKTVYGGQLLGRFENPTVGTALKLRETPESFRALQAAQRALQEGRLPVRTPSETNETITLPLIDAFGHPVDLNWPEFAGEDFKDFVVDARHLTPAWMERATRSSGILLMLRPSLEMDAPGVTATAGEVSERTDGTDAQQPPVGALAPDARYVELTQLLLKARGYARRDRVYWPLAVVLSCWDELDQAASLSPGEVLRDRYPLLGQFLQANWFTEDLAIFGLSSTERALRYGADGYDEEFVNADPTLQGYIVTKEGKRSQDLTLPLAWLLERARQHDI